MARQKDYKGYTWIPRVLSSDCTNKKCKGSNHLAKWCVSTTSKVAQENYSKFIKNKPEYTKEDLLKWVPLEYRSMVKVFMKSNADKVAEHQTKWDHEIYLEEGKKTPFVRNYKPLLDQETSAMKKYIDKYLGKSFIWPSSLATASSILLVTKPGRGLHFCIDYRALNAMTVKNRYLIPLILETLRKLAGFVKYTKLDVIHAFNQISMKKGHKWLTAFNNRYGQFEYLVIPFGLCNAPRTFQRSINEPLQEYLDVFCTAYLDDVLIYSNNKADHLGHVLQVLKRLHKRGLQVDIDKCKFNTTRVKYLGMIVTTNGIEIDTKKVEAIQKWETPSTVKDVQAFLGFANFYWRFIPDFSKKVKPLNELTKGTQYTTKKSTNKVRYDVFIWSKRCQQAFEDLKRAFTTAPVLAHYDLSLETWVETNASDFVVAGVLSQKHGKMLRPVAYFSKKITSAECNYMIYDKQV